MNLIRLTTKDDGTVTREFISSLPIMNGLPFNVMKCPDAWYNQISRDGRTVACAFSLGGAWRTRMYDTSGREAVMFHEWIHPTIAVDKKDRTELVDRLIFDGQRMYDYFKENDRWRLRRNEGMDSLSDDGRMLWAYEHPCLKIRWFSLGQERQFITEAKVEFEEGMQFTGTYAFILQSVPP